MRIVVDVVTKNKIKDVRKFNIPRTNNSHCEAFGWAEKVWIAKPGDYSFLLNLDGKNIGQLPLKISRL